MKPVTMKLEDLGRSKKIPVAVLGATGTVGQRFITLLESHPWFEVTTITASERSAGKAYRDVVSWMQAAPPPPAVAALTLLPTIPSLPQLRPSCCPLVFSALDASIASEIESELAANGTMVVSNTRCHRMDPEVPLLVPEVNPDHLELASKQSFAPGSIITNPNCSTIGLVLALKPLADAFGLDSLNVVTLQAISGAGLPGLSSYEILDNVIPYIGGEEEKMERESRKILGSIRDGRIEPASFTISAQCNRVGVIDGHTLCVSVRFERPASLEEVRDAWEAFSAEPQELGLPSAPTHPLHYLAGDNAPQPRLHRDLGGGMAVALGRLRPCNLLDFKFVALSHNTVRGAAGGALLAGELAVARGLLHRGGSLVSEPVAAKVAG